MSGYRPCTAVDEQTRIAVACAFEGDRESAYQALLLAARALRVPDDIMILNAATEAVEVGVQIAEVLRAGSSLR